MNRSRIIQPIGDKIIIPKRKMWMGREDQMPPRILYPKLSKKSILSPGSSEGSASPSGGGAPTFEECWLDTDGGTGGTVTITPTAGNTLVVSVLTYEDADTSTCTDNQGNSYTKITTVASTGSFQTRITLFYCSNIISSGAHIITYSGGGASQYTSCFVCELGGARTKGESATAGSTGTGTNPQTGPLTNLTADNSIFIAAMINGGLGRTITENDTGTVPDGEWILPANGEFSGNASAMSGAIAYYIASTELERSHGWLLSGAENWACIIATFY